MITIENADKALKSYYLDAISAQLNESISPFFAAIEKSTNNVFGKDVKMMVMGDCGGNVIAGSEDGDLPSPYANRYYDITVPLKNIYGTIEISDKALRASQNSAGAFVNLLNAETEGLVSAAKFNFQRMLYGNGTGFLTAAPQRVSERVFKVDTTKYMFPGMKVDLLDDPDHINGGDDLTIVNVDHQNQTVTVDRDIAESDYYDTCAFFVHGAYGNELFGLKTIFDKGTLYGHTKSEESYFRPKIKTVKEAEFTEDYLVAAMDEIEENFSQKPNMILCSFKTRRKIAAILTANRAVVDTTTLQGGYGAILFNGVPVVADKFCPDNAIFVINTEDFILHQLCDWEWLEDEDGKILKQIPGKAAYSATLVKYAELVCSKPCAQMEINIINN